MRLSSAVPVRSAQIIVAGKVLMVCEAVAEAVRAHRIGKDQAETAYHHAGYGRPQPGRSYASAEWRDATFDDLSALEEMKANAAQAMG